MKNEIIIYFLVCKGRSNDDVGGASGTVFQDIRPGSGFKTGDFVREKVWGLPQNDSFTVWYNTRGTQVTFAGLQFWFA